QIVSRRRVFAMLLNMGQALRSVLPAPVRAHVPDAAPAPKPRPVPHHARRMLMLEGCVQPSLSPNTNAAAARVLDQLGLGILDASGAGCCGATDYHLGGQRRGLDRARRNIDAWWPAIQQGVEAIVQTASGCGAFVKEYGHLLRDDPLYAERASRVSELAQDLSEIVRAEPLDMIRPLSTGKVAFHCPCTLQHAQRLDGAVVDILMRLGFQLTPVPDARLCCGSVGTYSNTQPDLSRSLRRNKIKALESGAPTVIATANIGCQMHLAGATEL